MNPTQRQALMEELGITMLTEGMQNEIIGNVGQYMLTEVLLATLAELPTEAQDAFKALTEEGRGDEAEAIATQFIPDYPLFVAKHSNVAKERVKATYAEWRSMFGAART